MYPFAMLLLFLLALIFAGIGLIIYASNQDDRQWAWVGVSLLCLAAILLVATGSLAQHLRLVQ